GYSIEDMDEFLNQTLGGVSSQVKQASWMVILLALGVASLMVLLFSRLRMTRERQMLMTKRAMGFSLRDISLQELYPVLLSGGLGVILGVILTEWMGESLVSLLLGMLGIGLKQVEFSAFPVWKVMGLLILLLSGPALVTLLSCRPIRKMSMTKYLND
ncbi:MAG: FtsX-like permease family protein, partial [Lachnospiraceae bacterium]